MVARAMWSGGKIKQVYVFFNNTATTTGAIENATPSRRLRELYPTRPSNARRNEHHGLSLAAFFASGTLFGSGLFLCCSLGRRFPAR